MTPQRNKYWLLDSVAGWRIPPGDLIPNPNALVFTPVDGDLMLDSLPGNAEFLDSSLVGCITCPIALAGDSKGRVFVLDSATARVSIMSPAENRTAPITAFGGLGKTLRHFHFPRAITVLPSSSIAVADRGRVQFFSGPPYVLLHVWTGAINPQALASDHCGIVYILDRATRSVLRVRADGEWLPPIGTGTLTDPVDLAVDAHQTVAVVDGQGTAAAIVIFPPTGEKPVRLTNVAAPLSVAFDDTGNLFVGTGRAVISKLEPNPDDSADWSLAGDGVSDVDGSIVKVVWVPGQGLFAILNGTSSSMPPRLFSMSTSGAFVLQGSFETDPLESDIETCPWHRVQVVGTVPAGTTLQIDSSTSETKDAAAFGPYERCLLAGGDNPDCLVQSPPGQYLKLRVTFRSNGTASPQIHALKIFFPRESYLQYLPSVFQDDDESRRFLDRFLSIFQTTFDNFDQSIDTLWQVFDPFMTPDQYFDWLAAWMALPLDPGTPTLTKRKLLKNAFANYLIRGTPAGIEQAIQNYTGVENIRILEHFRLRNWTALPLEGGLNQGSRLWSSSFYARLQVGVRSQIGTFKLTNSPEPAAEPLDWGAHRFSLLFPANPYTVQDTQAKIQNIADREKPAHTEAVLCPVFARLRVGVQATLGIDAYLGKTDAVILGKLARLRYDSVLSSSQAVRDLRALGASPYPRLGVDARIL
jgi:phage tail-like protein